VGHQPNGIAIGDGGVWVADTGDNAVVRIDPSTQAVITTIPVGDNPLGIAVGAGSVWVANSGNGTVSRIDPQTNRVIATVAVGGSPQALTIADGRAWVTVDPSVFPSTVAASGGTLRIDAAYDVDYMDPALAYEPLSASLLYATCAQLVNYPDRSGAAATELVPEVARSMPAITDGGRTYTFVVRRGFRFAPPSNQPVTAQVFKDTIERTLSPVMKSPVVSELDDVVGARAYIDGKAQHITGVVASGDRLIIDLIAPDPVLLNLLAEPFFCAVPPDTPRNPRGVRVIPSAGPYTTASYTPGQGVVLVRNPNYRGDRPHHFARIEVSVNVPGARALAQVEAGQADYAFDGELQASEATSLAARYGAGSPAAKRGHQQYFVNAQPQLDFYVLNTHRSLFSHQRLREAVNYAVNRRALARLGDMHSTFPDQPTDHYLPPGIPGYRDAAVYPQTPDLVKARRLARGFGGSTVVLYTCDRQACAEQGQVIKHDLAAIDLHVVVKTFSVPEIYTLYNVPREPYDMGLVWWSADYPDPYDFTNLLLEGGQDLPTFKDPAVARKLAAAARLTGVDRYLTYEKLDRELAATAAPWVSFGDSSTHELFSARIGCQVYSPIYATDIAALCVRHKVARPRAKA
jgi:peptide/nickel transport system substrate-binding protein